jgi:iron only hydrogenase large subunit-like protein
MAPDQYYHAHEINTEICNGHMKCMRVCPTNAIRVRDGKASIISELCVDCGECIRACPHRAVVPLADRLGDVSHDYKCSAAIPSPVLYSQFPSDVPPSQILEGLKQMGFDYVFNVAPACEWSIIAAQVYLREHTGPWPMISGFCPAVVRFIQVKYPDLTKHILPMEVPREITAREAKRQLSRNLDIAESDVEAVYITACPAKVVSIRQPAEKKSSYLDRAIAISEVYGPLRGITTTEHESTRLQLFEDPNYGAGWSRLGAMTSLLETDRWLAVSGMNDVTKILDDIENSKLRDVEFVEASACLGGCIGGSLTVENIYVARSRTIRLEQKYGRNIRRHERRVEQLYRDGFFAMENPIAPRPLSPLDPDISQAIAKVRMRDEIYDALPKIDCGACGSPGCLTFAEDVVKGDVDVSDCIVLASR